MTMSICLLVKYHLLKHQLIKMFCNFKLAESPEKLCTENWKAAADEAKKKMWGIFEETGIFACTCHHGMMLWIVNMVHSGKLFKYPLSIMNKALKVLSSQLLISYDVGCKLATTVKSTSLATKFNESNSHLCIDAFHVYMHNYVCQDQNHPNLLTSSNAKTITFKHAKLSLCITDESIEEWQKQQSVYLETLGEEAEWDMHVMMAAAQNASASFLNAIPFDYQFVSTSTATSTDATYAANLLHANEHLDTILQEIAAMEVKIGITRRWEPSDIYHMRTHIAKALQTHCKAIQNKVKEYNAVASALVLPALSLDWSHISHYGLMSSHFSMKSSKMYKQINGPVRKCVN
ncbi:hypothetical protein DFJ58DRAFT_841091 [Suillus subalutaceus]|uniref:uncharacterized protein n=1 Tax=Suillus subalutaceus TaxID=48586 RepID=UPI001B87C785|nr:uncharacterized protein DFJ58DRAFT_841091 [Suillus subalutaceus]KAG1855664.1 hypothetical protein DFJ58DRAFT_841091 [Suillus subalutaceus]